jgi:hypothetical protein
MGKFSAGFWLAVLALVAVGARPADAFKWHQCPAPPLPVFPSDLGATSAPFIHPGHELSIFLNDSQVQLSGGFSTAEGGNSIAITFASLFGDAIALPARAASAASPSALTFDFPSTSDEVGRTLAGPVEITVTVEGRVVAHIRSQDFVAVPAAADVTPILFGGEADQIVEAALGSDGDLWVPASFSGHPMSMPGCEGDFIMPVTLNIGGAALIGPVEFPFDPTDRVRQVSGYLGDMVINGTNFYGMLKPDRIQLVQIAGTLGVSICMLNDASDLVLRVQGNQSWAQPNSPFRLVARDSAPLALHLHSAPPVPLSPTGASRSNITIAPGEVDSFGGQCASPPAPKAASLTAPLSLKR